jgi:hypothetical protein
MQAEQLHLENLPLAEAQAQAVSLIKSFRAKQAKINNLIRDVHRARTSREVQRIMWNTLLAGTGFGTVDSQWQKFHKMT